MITPETLFYKMRRLKPYMKWIVLFQCCLLHSQAQQLNRLAHQKSLPSFQHHYKSSTGNNKYTYTCLLSTLQNLSQLLDSSKEVTLKRIYEPASLIVITCTPSVAAQLAMHPQVKWIDVLQTPREELIFGATDFTANKITTIHNRFPQWNAHGISLSVKEQRFDTLDIDFRNRIIPSAFGAPNVSTHASVMTTLIAGAGNTSNDTKGAAWGAAVSTASFLNLLPEPDLYYQSSFITVQNHSYGTQVEHYYGTEALAYDISVMNNPSLLHVFSAGNSGTLTPSSGAYTGIPGYANLTGNFKQFKNGITVGHIDSFMNVLSPSSKGPAYDGRLKPEIVAFGEDGSSGAAALTSGAAAVLQQIYKEKNNGNPAPASLIKAVLLNSADDVDAPGIDFKSGFGNLNAWKAVQTMDAAHYFNGTVVPNGEQKFTLTLPAGIRKLKVMLVWTDAAAPVNATKALVNDLDLIVRHTNSNTVWHPWVLNASPLLSSLQQLPVRKRDSLNNAELVTIDDPAAGNYEFSVNAFSLSTPNQTFSVAYQLDTGNVLEWLYPTCTDHLLSNQANVLRFRNTYSSTAGTLEVSTNNGNSWQTITNAVNLNNGYYKWQTPDVFTKALLRITVNGNTYTSDTFTISKRVSVRTGYNCPDSVLMYWNKVNEATGYRIYNLGNKYLEPLVTTTDTSLLVSKTAITNTYFAVEPLLQTKAAIRSYTLNYETDGTGCYIRNFYTVLNAFNNGDLFLELGTSYRIKSISIEKRKAGGFEILLNVPVTTALQYRFTDNRLIRGSNIYRAVIELSDGRKIYSDVAILYFNGTQPAVVYPNPAPREGTVTVLVEQDDNLRFELINNLGRVVMAKQLNDYPQQISLHRLPKGVYYYRVTKAGSQIQSGKLVIH
jgi:hypothetical protein